MNILSLQDHLPPFHMYETADREEKIRIIQEALIDFEQKSAQEMESKNLKLNLKVDWPTVVDNFATIGETFKVRGLAVSCVHEIRVLALDAAYQIENQLVKNEIAHLTLRCAALEKEVDKLKQELAAVKGKEDSDV